MQIIAVSDIFGRTKAFEKLCNDISEEIDILVSAQPTTPSNFAQRPEYWSLPDPGGSHDPRTKAAILA